MNTLINNLKKWAEKTPHKIFITEDDMSWSFQSFYEDLAKVSALFKARGMSKGDYVVVHLDKKSDHLLAYMALLNIGAICVHLYPEREDTYVKFAAEHCNAKFIVSHKFADTLPGISLIDNLEYEDFEPMYANDTHEIAYVMFTSGTTSTPKAVQVTQENLLFISNTLINLVHMQEGYEKEIIFMPLGSTGGLGHFHACLMLGNYIRLFPGFYTKLRDEDIELLCDVIEKEKITGLLLTPALVTRILLNHKGSLQRVSGSLHYLLANVTPMRREIIMELLNLLPNVRFCTYYGLTEASRSIVNVCRENIGYEHLTGKSGPNVDIKINNPNENGEGEVCIKGANVMKGYLHSGSDGFEDGWFLSGDIGKIDANGFIHVLGRINEVISIDGFKLFPNEIENILRSHHAIEDVGVCAVMDDRTYNQIGLVVVTDHQTNKEQLAQEIYTLLKKKYNEDLYSYKIPKKVYFEKEIPRTDLGKVKRDALAVLLSKNKKPYYISQEN